MTNLFADYMGTGGWSAGCWVLLGLLRITNPASVNCITLEFDGLKPSDKRIEIKENSYINLTAHLKWPPGCERSPKDRIQLKITYKEGWFSMDVCKLILTTNCTESDTSTAASICRCLNKSSVQFYKKVSKSDSRNYTWTWVNIGKNSTADKQKEIFISVTNMSLEEHSITPLIAASTCAFFGVVAAAGVGYVLWKRNVLSSCQGYCLSPTGADAEYRATDQDTRQVDESVSTDIKDPCYSEVNDDDMSNLDDPGYVHVGDEISRPGQRRYVFIGKQGISHAHGPTYLHPKQEGTNQQRDSTYDHLCAIK